MLSHPVLVKRVVWLQMILVASMVVLGALYALGLWINNSLMLYILDPMISAVATAWFYGLFLIPVAWIVGRFIFLRVFSRRPVAIELRERLQRLAGETLSRMSVNPGNTRFVVGKSSGSASVRRSHSRDTIRVGEHLMQSASDDEIIGILGHELGHILKGHMWKKGAWTGLYVLAYLAISYEAAQSHFATIIGLAGLAALILVGIPINWRIEYSADKFSAERLGAKPMVSALERLRMTNPDCVSFTHPPLSRRIRRIQTLSIAPLITHVYA
jgi:Zn-dependent protease with chaperone function